MTIRVALLLCAIVAPALAHVTPPIVLASDRDAITTLLPGARRHFVREVRLTDEERQAIQMESGWRPEEDFYRFYIGRDEQLHDVGAVAFLTQYTIHGPVRVAVGLAPDGKIKGTDAGVEIWWGKGDVRFTGQYFFSLALSRKDVARLFVEAFPESEQVLELLAGARPKKTSDQTDLPSNAAA